MHTFTLRAGVIAVCLVMPAVAIAQSFVNWENPHVHPLDITPGGQLLLAVNTADNRLEVFSIASGVPVKTGSIPVGLDPVSVRARTSTEAWVVNHISDSVSIVDLATMRVRATLRTSDEPADVVFAGSPARAFVSCSQANQVMVFDPANLATAPTSIAILGEDPRALAVSPDGSRVYAAIFESGNNSTVLGGGAAVASVIGFPPNVVSLASGPYAGVNPPPNSGASFDPPINPASNPPIRVSLIVKKNPAGQWLDDNTGNWTNFVSGAQAAQSGRVVGWDLYDHDVAIIDASSLSVSYATGLMNIVMAAGVNPATGEITVVGTDATNEIRYEPNVNGTFLRVNLAIVNPANPALKTIRDLNSHLTYASPTIAQAQRDRAIGDPRSIEWNAAGTRGYITGMGSSNLVVVDAAGLRAGITPTQTIEVGEGPTGAAVDNARSRVYVLNKFEGSISVVSTLTETEVARVPYFDPTPSAIKTGRKHLYDTHKNSGLGHAACASCHVDARNDRLAWDLGDPSQGPQALTGNNLGQGLFGLEPGSVASLGNPAFQPFHAMKGPMTTQTLQEIIGKEPHHWRGDRAGIEAFNGAFIGLQGDDANLTALEMQQFEDFLASITIPPNPFRTLQNTLPASMPLPGHFTVPRFPPAGQPLPNGNAQNGLALYRNTTRRLDGGAFACVTCHTLPLGMGPDYTRTNPISGNYIPIAPGPMGERHHALVSVDGVTNVAMKTPQLRTLYEKTGFNATQSRNTSGFGVLHDGSVDSIERFVAEPAFTVANTQEVADLTAFLLAFSGSDLPQGSVANPLEPPGTPSKDTHAAVGVQTTLVSESTAPPSQLTLISDLVAIADPPATRVALVAKGLVAGKQRGWKYNGLSSGLWQSDKSGEPAISTAALRALAAPGSEITFTAVPKGSETRIGIDRDSDGFLDRTEVELCSDPANPASTPGTTQSVDVNGDLAISVQDIFDFLSLWSAGNADFNRDGATTVQDIFDFLSAWSAGGCG